MENKILQKAMEYFPEYTLAEFVSNYIVHENDITTNTLEDIKDLDNRIANISNNIAIAKEVELGAFKKAEDAKKAKMAEIIYKTNAHIQFTYNASSNFSKEENKFLLSNEGARKAFAEYIVEQMITDNVLENPVAHETRYNILNSIWFSTKEIAQRLENWSYIESNKMRKSYD